MNKPAFPIHYTPRVNGNREQAAGCYGLRHAAPGYVIRHRWTVHLTRVRSREPSSICSVSHPGLENVTISFGDRQVSYHGFLFPSCKTAEARIQIGTKAPPPRSYTGGRGRIFVCRARFTPALLFPVPHRCRTHYMMEDTNQW